MSAQIHRLIESIRLARWQRLAIYAATGWLFTTGAIWLLARYFLRTVGEFGETIHPLEPWMLRLHGMGMLSGLILYGTLLRAHMIKAWHFRRNRPSGALTTALIVMLIVSGYLLYYAGDEVVRPVVSVVHWALGLGLGVALPVHIWLGRRRVFVATRKSVVDTPAVQRAQQVG